MRYYELTEGGKTENGFRSIPFDDLPKETQEDICENVADRNSFFKENGYSGEDARANLSGLAKPPEVRVGNANVQTLAATMTRSNSSAAVSKYVKMLRDNPNFEFDPIIIANGKFVDGGHRLEAYLKAGRKTIPVVECGHIVFASEETWDQWMSGDANASFPMDESVEMIDEIEMMSGPYEANVMGDIDDMLSEGDFKDVGVLDGVRIKFLKTYYDDCYLFYRGDKPMGYATFTFNRTIGGYMSRIALLPEYRGTGFGLKFYKWMIHQGKVLVSGGTQSENARNLWTKLMRDPEISVTGVDRQYQPINPYKASPWVKWEDLYKDKAEAGWRLVAKLKESAEIDEVQRSNPINPNAVIVAALQHRKEMKYMGSYDDVKVFKADDGRSMYLLLQKDGKTIGAADMEKNRLSDIDGWYMTEIGLKDAARGYGYGYGLYRFLIGMGYTLLSGSSHSKDGEKVWRKLMQDPQVTVSALRLNMAHLREPPKTSFPRPLPRDTLNSLDINEIDPWSDRDVVLMARGARYSEINEIAEFDWDVDFESELASCKFKDSDPVFGKLIGKSGELTITTHYPQSDDMAISFAFRDGHEIVGFADIRTIPLDIGDFDKVYQITTILMRSDYQDKGYGSAFYKLLLSKGFVLASDRKQTSGSKKIWQVLMADKSYEVMGFRAVGIDIKPFELGGVDPWSDPKLLLLAFSRRLVTESLTDVLPFTWRVQDSLVWAADFSAGKNNYKLEIARHKGYGNIWVLQFAQIKKSWLGFDKARIDVTGAGSAFGVLSTVIACVRDFLSQERPDALYFSSKGQSRGKLYTAILQKLKGSLKGYTFTKVADDTQHTNFAITPVRE